MYKVFMQDKPVTFTSDPAVGAAKVLEPAQGVNFVSEVLHAANANPSVVVLGDADLLFREFRSHFKLIEAAGGFIINEALESLWIFRNSMWDLPKGKLDAGETAVKAAIREVQEETGIMELEILRDMPSTWHTYEHDGRPILKRTFWYLMQASKSQPLKPQSEEGITQVVWVSKEELDEKIEATYASIHHLLQSFPEVLPQP